MLELELGEGMVPGSGVTVCTGNGDLSREPAPSTYRPEASSEQSSVLTCRAAGTVASDMR